MFECKHPLIPCNMHELRTSYDHIRKGGNTLTRIVELLKNPNLETEFYRRLGWELKPAEEIISCIVSCNGMFPGLSVDGHPVRRLPELVNMIESGTIRIISENYEIAEIDSDTGGGRMQELDLRKGANLTPEFLRQYINEDLLHASTFRAMMEWDRKYRIGKWTLTFSTFLLDAIALRKELVERFGVN